MNKFGLLVTTGIIGVLVGTFAMSASSNSAGESSKPSGATGTGKVAAGQAKTNQFWWPEELDLAPLRSHDVKSNPYGASFDYAEEFKTLDLDALKKDIDTLLTTSQEWWPSDYGNYGPFFIRMAWHSSGTYRTHDGRGGAAGGQQRFNPLNSWPDNGNLDKARRLLWPIKQKYGRKISWADLMVLSGNVAMENMGFKTFAFAGGRGDDWEPDLVYWGPEVEMLASDRHGKDGKLQRPLGATHMGLIYVNPEGPKGIPDALASAKNIRVAFARMAMDDEETVALVAGGHTFGKMHGAHKPSKCLEAEPAGAGLEEQALGWKNKCGKGHSEDTTTSGLEGAWTSAPAEWTHMYLTNLFAYEWKQVESPAGAIQWIPTDEAAAQIVPDAHVEGKFHAPVMTTADLALKADPVYNKISKRFLDNPAEFEAAFGRAWFKLTHRDMGPRARYVAENLPEALSWQDPVPAVDYTLISDGQVSKLKAKILDSDASVPQLVKAAWASASTFRASDMRGGANGARVRLAPQKDWAVNNPAELAKTLEVLEKVAKDFNENLGGDKKVSLADTIVIGGAAAIEKAAKDAGQTVNVPVALGRTDASQEATDVVSFAALESKADGFRNYYDSASYRSPTNALINKANLLDLSVPEMTVLVGGLRTLDTNADGAKHGVLTTQPGTLSNDFFVNLLDMSTTWKKSATAGLYEGTDRKSGAAKWTATPVDLIFGSNTELRAVAEAYASDDAKQQFVNDFVSAWTKVMRADRFDIK